MEKTETKTPPRLPQGVQRRRHTCMGGISSWLLAWLLYSFQLTLVSPPPGLDIIIYVNPGLEQTPVSAWAKYFRTFGPVTQAVDGVDLVDSVDGVAENSARGRSNDLFISAARAKTGI